MKKIIYRLHDPAFNGIIKKEALISDEVGDLAIEKKRKKEPFILNGVGLINHTDILQILCTDEAELIKAQIRHQNRIKSVQNKNKYNIPTLWETDPPPKEDIHAIRAVVFEDLKPYVYKKEGKVYEKEGVIGNLVSESFFAKMVNIQAISIWNIQKKRPDITADYINRGRLILNQN